MNKEYTADNSKLLKEIPNFKFTPYKDGMFMLYSYLKDKQKV